MTAHVRDHRIDSSRGERDLLAQACAAGLVTDRELADGAVRLRVQARGRAVHALLVHGHPIAYAKESATGAAVDDIARERRTLNLLAGLDIAPRVLPSAEQDDALWLDAVAGAGLRFQRGTMAQLAEVCRTWGAAVALLHRGAIERGRDAAGVRSLAPRPLVLEPDRMPRTPRRVSAGSAAQLVLRAMTGEPLLQRTSAEVADRWSEQHWIHGALSPAHVVVSQQPELRVRFIDFARSGLGDPGWDLATALDGISWLTSSGAPAWRRLSAELLAEDFLHGYRRAAGPGHLDNGMRAVRAVATAWDIATSAASATAGSEAYRLTSTWLERARDLAGRRSSPHLAA